MAVFTECTPKDVDALCEDLGLGRALSLTPIAAGSVNSNFFLETTLGRFFFRIYEEQSADGVSYEHDVLRHLKSNAIPVPAPVGRSQHHSLSINYLFDKPVGFFELSPGEMRCQSVVDVEVARSVGELLARIHLAGETFGTRRPSRFELGDLERRLDFIEEANDAELVSVTRTLRERLREFASVRVQPCGQGLIHGDMFRDNVLWMGADVSAVLDWESASDGYYGYDLMVTVLAWCYSDRLRLDWVHALTSSYQSVRSAITEDGDALLFFAQLAATRFSITRITDFHLKKGKGERTHKDYRRFLRRLEELSTFTPAQWQQVLFVSA